MNQPGVECDVPVEAGETVHLYCANRFPPDAYQVSDQNRSQLGRELALLKKSKEPTVELRALEIDGPVAVPPRVEAFFGEWPPKLNRAELESKLLPLAELAFRRPLTTQESGQLTESVLRHGQQVEQPEFAWHYAIRRLLCSPAFLYREANDSEILDDYSLATRLSYFLWSSMPDQPLIDLAKSGTLSDENNSSATNQTNASRSKSGSIDQAFHRSMAGQPNGRLGQCL